MKYYEKIVLKDGRECILRNGTAEDAQGELDVFNLTHGQTDYLLTYPKESHITVEEEAKFLQEKTDSCDEIEIIAVCDGKIIGSAGIERLDRKLKVAHRATFGISIDKAYWGLGVGRALTNACIECAKNAMYLQLELDVVADNENAISLYRSVGFEEYGRNPKGFHSIYSGWQELILMRLWLGRRKESDPTEDAAHPQ